MMNSHRRKQGAAASAIASLRARSARVERFARNFENMALHRMSNFKKAPVRSDITGPGEKNAMEFEKRMKKLKGRREP